MTVRVATWNLWWRFGDHEVRQAVIAAELDRLDADVVCIQEAWGEADENAVPGNVRVDDEGSDQTTQAGDLAAQTGLVHWRSAWRVAHEGHSFGNAILSRHPVRATHAMALPTGGEPDEYRTALLVEVETPSGPIAVATTHLNFQWDHSDVRQVQVAAICRWLADLRPDDTPLVLTGDLNAQPISDEVRMLTGRAAVPVRGLGFHDAWEAAGDGDGATWSRTNSHTPDPPFEGDKRIDYVLCGFPLSRGRSVAVGAELLGTRADADGHHPSDHFGVAVDVTTGPKDDDASQ